MKIVEHMPFAEYAAAPGVNASLLKIVHRECLAKAKAHLDGRYKKESAALDFGHCFHSFTLEGREDFSIKPEMYDSDDGPKKWNANANVCKAWKSEQGDRLILSADEAASIYSMSKAVRERLGDLMEGRIEVSLFADRKDGIALKNRADLIPHKENAPIIDLKSCASAEPNKFLKSSIDLGYDLQVAFTIDVAKLCGIERKDFWLVAVETEYPHPISVLRFRDEPCSFLRAGRAKYRRALQMLKNAMDEGSWPGYGSAPAEEYAMPWMLKELEATA